jgi:hypothetical protein
LLDHQRTFFEKKAPALDSGATSAAAWWIPRARRPSAALGSCGWPLFRRERAKFLSLFRWERGEISRKFRENFVEISLKFRNVLRAHMRKVPLGALVVRKISLKFR